MHETVEFLEVACKSALIFGAFIARKMASRDVAKVMQSFFMNHIFKILMKISLFFNTTSVDKYFCCSPYLVRVHAQIAFSPCPDFSFIIIIFSLFDDF